MKSVNKNNRAMILVNAIGVVFAVIIVQLFFIQIIDAGKYQKLASREQIKQYEIPASRGLIYAMDGKNPTKLVMNETVYNVFADPQELNNSKKSEEKTREYKLEIAKTLREIAGGELVENFETLFDKKDSRYQVIARKLSRKQAEKIKEKKFHGIGFTPETRRVYPEGNLASQVLGFVNAEGGNYGVEAAFNKNLLGKNGLLKTTTDIYGGPLVIGKENVSVEAQNGKNIVLSIDRNIQSRVEKILQAKLQEMGIKNGSVLVMNPNDGKIMAMANFPAFDPAKYGETKEISAFNNNAATMAYENGSVIKTLTMAMGLNEGVASADARFYNTDSVKIEDRTIKNATLGQTGSITFQTAMNYSLNTGMVEIAKRLGGGSINRSARDKIYDYFYNRFGLGRETGIEVIESKGIVVSPEKHEGNAVRYSNMSFGQGMDTTMVQTASAFSAAINGGTLYRPTLINGEIKPDGKFEKTSSEIRNQNVISENSSAQLRDILVNARRSIKPIQDPNGYRVGGKTGTSETLINGKYVDNQTIASYLGFGGNSTPKFVIMVAVWGEGQNPQGNRHAQPIFTEISNWLLNYLKIKPEGQ